jgi:hypothetical protein
MKGDDIEDFQRELNKRFSAWKINKHVTEDGDFGKQTRDGAREVCTGLGISHQTAMKNGVTPQLRTKIRHPRTKRTDVEIARSEGEAAKKFRAELREQFRTAGSLAGVHVTATAGKSHWGGSNDLMTAFVEPFMVKRGLPIGSGKRTPAQNKAVGGSKNSDHLTTKTATAARDFPTFTGEGHARALAKAMGISSWQPNKHTTFALAPVDGHKFAVQILWGAGIDHGDHVHVGISRA